MIAVNLIYDPLYEDRFAPIVQLGPLLADFSVKLLVHDTASTADTCVIQSHLLREMRARKDPRAAGPIIVHERADQETVSPGNRDLIREANTIGWFKECGIRDSSLHNAPHVLGYYHWSLLNRDREKYPAVKPDIELTQAELEKIALPFSVASYSHFDPIRERQSSPQSARNIDVFMYGSVHAERELYRAHRYDACRAVAQLADRGKPINVLLSVGRLLDWNEACDLMLRSKIIVSQYGYSMSSYRDWNALYAGCVLIRPDASLQVNYLPDLFKDNEWYVPCAPDFSDLGQKVDMVLSDYPRYYEKAQIARAALFESLSLERRAADFYHILMAALGRTPAESVPRYPLIEPLSYRPPPPRRARRGPNLFGPTAALGGAGWDVTRARFEPEPRRGPGGVAGWKLVEDTSDATHDFRRYVDKRPASEPFVFSVIVKPDERTDIRAWIMAPSHANGVEAFFDLTEGAVRKTLAWGDGWAPMGAGVVSLEDGWWWCWVAARSDAADRIGVLVTLDTADRTGEYPGDGRSGAWFASPRLEEGTVPTLTLSLD